MLKHRSTFLTIKPRKKYLDISFFLDVKTEDFPDLQIVTKIQTSCAPCREAGITKRHFSIGEILDQNIVSVNSRKMTTRESLIQKLQTYQSNIPEELKFRAQFLELLQHPRCFHRDFLPVHITGSAFIIDKEAEHEQ